MSTKRQHAERQGEGHHPQGKVLEDLRTIDVDEIGVDARHRPLVEPQTDASFEVVAQTDEPVAPDGAVVEVAEIKGEQVEVLDQDVVLDSGGFAANREVPKVERQ